MKPKQYTLEIAEPLPSPASQDFRFLDVVEEDRVLRLRWRVPDDCPTIVRRSTGERGKLIRAVTDDWRTIPRHGKVTLTVAWFIRGDGGEPIYHRWDENDWVVQE